MFTRRQFCKRAVEIGAATTIGTGLGGDSASAQAAESSRRDVRKLMKTAGGPRGWRIGAGLNGFMSSASKFKKNYPIWEILDFCHRQRFDGIELVVGWPMGGYPSPDDTKRIDVISGGKGKPEVMLAALGVEHIGHVHLTDTDGTMFGGTSKHLACGDGHCDMAASLETLWKGGYRGWIMIDGWMIDDVYDACSKGKRAIEAVLAGIARP